MHNYKSDPDKIKRTQGMFPFFDEETLKSGETLLCSNCFNDEGLRLNAISVGIPDSLTCEQCGSIDGYKLTKEQIRKLCYQFFVQGTLKRFKYGGCSLIQANELRVNDSDIQTSAWLENDVKLIERHGELGLFNYLPRFWMLGDIEPLISLQDPNEIDNVIAMILEHYPKHLLLSDHPFYRIRLNPASPHDPSQYDSAPDQFIGGNRFDDCGAVLYASPDLELCIHECRATVNDDVFVAKLVPAGELKMLNLSAKIEEEGKDEFTSLDIAIHFLFLAGKHSYPICGYIAKRIKDAGYDGVIYPSFFSDLRNGAVPFEYIFGMSKRRFGNYSIQNVAIFGRPIAENKLRVHSVNRVVINQVKYNFTFGPAYLGEDMDNITADTLKTRQLERITALFNKPNRND